MVVGKVVLGGGPEVARLVGEESGEKSVSVAGKGVVGCRVGHLVSSSCPLSSPLAALVLDFYA